jgi:hypothetical protein
MNTGYSALYEFEQLFNLCQIAVRMSSGYFHAAAWQPLRSNISPAAVVPVCTI